jgi:hypothetical protein
VSFSPTVSVTPTVSFSPTVSITPTVSFSPTVSVTPTVSVSSTSTPTGSTQALVNGISAGSAAQAPTNSISPTGIGIIAALGGILATIVIYTIRKRSQKRQNPVSHWGPSHRTHANRMEKPMHTLEVSHNPAVQSWRQNSSPAFSTRHLDTVRSKRAFDPVIVGV